MVSFRDICWRNYLVNNFTNDFKSFEIRNSPENRGVAVLVFPKSKLLSFPFQMPLLKIEIFLESGSKKFGDVINCAAYSIRFHTLASSVAMSRRN